MVETEGQLFVVGIGPGKLEEMTLRARQALGACEVVVGYSLYTDLIAQIVDEKVIISSGMGREKERCEGALREALLGRKVAIVSSGDSGIYGMAGLVLEIARRQRVEEKIPIEIVPGVPVFVSAAALVGAPLMNDFAAISLSDLLNPWEKIEKKLEAAAAADFVTCLYNPKSRKRVRQIDRARDIFLKHRSKDTPCAVLRNVSRAGQSIITATLQNMLDNEIDMLSIVVVGNSETRLQGRWMITPRGYKVRS
jgi:precorrin-3B C17-methyltransferase